MAKAELLQELIKKIDANRAIYQENKDFYEGNHPVLSDQKKTMDEQSAVKAMFNYPAKTVDMYTGYMLGKPLSYVGKQGNDELLSDIDKHYSTWEKAHNVSLKRESSIHGSVYELVYVNTDGEFTCTYFTPMEAVVLHDGSVEKNIQMLVRKYTVEFDENEYIDVWDAEGYTKYDKDLNIIEQKPNFFSSCAVIEYPANDLRQSVFQNIKDTVRLYNTINATGANELLDNRAAYLVISGADMDIEQAAQMKKNGILILPQGAKAEWLLKDIPETFYTSVLNRWESEMYAQTRLANLNRDFQSNTSGVSLRLKLQELENTIAAQEVIFEKSLKKRLKFFCEYMKITENKDYDYRDISVAFTRNIPVDELSIVQMVTQLQGILPNETLLSWLPRIQNPALEIQKLEEEKAKETERSKDMYGDMQFNDTTQADPVQE